MDGELDAPLRRLREAFAGYPRRAVLDGCPHCRGPVTVADHDLFWLSITLGNTVGTVADVKALLPTFVAELVGGDELDPGIVLGRLAGSTGWRTWPAAEQAAIDETLRAVWRSLLSSYPARTGAFTDATEFLRAVTPLYAGPDGFLTAWDDVDGSAADRHLADLAVAWTDGRLRHPAVVAWLRRPAVRERLDRAFERDHAAAWADDLAFAHDLLR